MINILLVDDHKIIRDGIRAMLDFIDTFNIVGECESGHEVIPFITQNEVDIIIMDINMPDMNGIEVTELVISKFPAAKIIALTMHDQESYITKILKAGAMGYVLKNAGQDVLGEAINSVYAGKTYFSAGVSEIMMSKYLKNPSKKFVSNSMTSIDDLTSREKEIIALIADELTNNEIADKLFISARTVDTHRRNLLQKLGVKNTAGLVKFALQNNLAE
ncbi:response regulator transcription factor [Flavobacteriales bacterium]|nr:response regulator transcription factor [Flavobacteriales bacterium]